MSRKSHTTAETMVEIEKAIVNMDIFYQKSFLKWSGNTSDGEKKAYSEIIAKYLLDHSDLWKNIKPITRNKPYKTPSHVGIKNGDVKTNREEEWLAKSMFDNNDYNGIGKIIDYQTPLKNTKSDKAGKIDLLSMPDSSTLYLIELKKESNTETLLRCVLEIYTYSRIVDGKRLLHDFGLNENVVIKPIVAIFKNSVQYKQIKSPNVLKLIKELKVEIVALEAELKVKVESIKLPDITPRPSPYTPAPVK
jgi:hypothetical protein